MVSYSQSAAVAAITKYFKFLTTLYLDDADVEWPPEGGWPMITQNAFKSLDKSDGVVSLLRHLPYTKELNLPEEMRPQIVPGARLCNWKEYAADFENEQRSGQKLITEGFLAGEVNSHIIGLMEGGRDTPLILLDTQHGLVHWPDCDDQIRDETTQEQVDDDPDAWETEDEANWRGDAPAWAISDFYDMLREQFQTLRFIPINSRQVIDDYLGYSDDGEMESMLQQIYREHRWPDLERYEKTKCLEAVQRAMEERYPDFIFT